MDKNFNLDKVKAYLDGVLADEEYLNSYSAVAQDVYRVYSNRPRITVKDVEQYLRGLPIGVDYMYYKTAPLAREFARDIDILTKGTRDEIDVYWWAIATGIWVFGAVSEINPMYRGGN